MCTNKSRSEEEPTGEWNRYSVGEIARTVRRERETRHEREMRRERERERQIKMSWEINNNRLEGLHFLPV